MELESVQEEMCGTRKDKFMLQAKVGELRNSMKTLLLQNQQLKQDLKQSRLRKVRRIFVFNSGPHWSRLAYLIDYSILNVLACCLLPPLSLLPFWETQRQKWVILVGGAKPLAAEKVVGPLCGITKNLFPGLCAVAILLRCKLATFVPFFNQNPCVETHYLAK